MRLLRLSLAVIFVARETYASYRDFGIPVSSATVQVRAINTVNVTFVNNLGASIIEPVLPGHETVAYPDYAFLIDHKNSRFMFDLGLRSDPMNLAPSVSGVFAAGILKLDSAKNLTTFLQSGGIPVASINEVIWSHAHFDHVGDMSKFPNTTNLVVGAETDTATYPQSASATLLASDLAGRNLKKIDFTKSKLSFGSLQAIDYFGDGSFYLLNTPGHLPGHMSALARTTPTSFVYLGGDTHHHPAELRPRPEFQKAYPCPAHTLANARAAISTDYFWSPKSRNGAFDLASRAEPFMVASDLPGSLTVDVVKSLVSLGKVAAFDADPDFFVVAGHDISLRDSMPFFPATLNNWKATGLKEKTVWTFAEKTNPAFLFSPV
ncbi:beta-lactamase-like protein [Mycena filopes]|nr:beta-lactamase-like protein [Mycena filopes]